MYIQAESAATSRLGVRNPDTNDVVYVEFNEEGVARVKKEVGEFIASNIEAVEIIDREEHSQEDS